MSGKRYPGELKIEAVKQVVDRDLPPELTPGMILVTSTFADLFQSRPALPVGSKL